MLYLFMDDYKITLTTNNLGDIVRFLEDGCIVCIHCEKKGIYYYSPTTCKHIKLIYIDVGYMPSLLDEGEWPWYIKDSGFTEYTETSILPTNKENIHHFRL